MEFNHMYDESNASKDYDDLSQFFSDHFVNLFKNHYLVSSWIIGNDNNKTCNINGEIVIDPSNHFDTLGVMDCNIHTLGGYTTYKGCPEMFSINGHFIDNDNIELNLQNRFSKYCDVPSTSGMHLKRVEDNLNDDNLKGSLFSGKMSEEVQYFLNIDDSDRKIVYSTENNSEIVQDVD